MAKPPRSVVREPHFEKDLAALIGDLEAADDFVAGAEWLLAQNPEIGFPIAEGSAVWFLPMSPIEGAQSPKPTGQLLKGGNRGQKLALHHTGIREARIVVALLPSAKTTPAKVFPLSGW